ncbi:MAG: Hint domain-containing protein, partial [Acetobacteraceae bacterium]
GMTITQERDQPAVTYYHVELDSHAILLAEGAATESYLDTGNRGFFANSGQPLALHPDMAETARSDGSVAVDSVWRALRGRALDLGFTEPTHAVTADPHPRLIVDGVPVPPLGGTDGRYRFVVPRGANAAQLVSRTFLPVETSPYVDDWRRLGLAVSAIILHAGAESRTIAVDDPALSSGWHAPERSDPHLWRWTDGNAALPLNCPEGGVLEIRVRPGGPYRIDDRLAEPLAA